MIVENEIKVPGTRTYTVDSSNVDTVSYNRGGDMIVQFRRGGMYVYRGVSRQRATACARAASVGKYLNEKIKPHHAVERLA